MIDMIEFILVFSLFALPAASLVWFTVSQILFLKTPKENYEIKKTRKTLLTVASVVFGIMIGTLLVLSILFALAITHM